MAKSRKHEYYFKRIRYDGHIVIKASSKAEAVEIAKKYDSTLIYDFMF